MAREITTFKRHLLKFIENNKQENGFILALLLHAEIAGHTVVITPYPLGSKEYFCMECNKGYYYE